MSPREPIGPGRLVLVVGPSGAGKDTLIQRAREACAGDPSIVFPRRLVTRDAAVFEDHDCLSVEVFDAAARNGAFAFWWEAHGLKYGIPTAIDADVRTGRTIVCNVSRAIIERLRAKYARVCVTLITAPAEMLAERLAARNRGSDGRLSDRLQRAVAFDGSLHPDVVIENVGDPESGASKLLAVIRSQA